MKRTLLSTILVLLFTSYANAQFSNSSTIYIYEYDYTYDDGIKSQSSDKKGKLIFVNIQNNILGFYGNVDKSYAKRKLIDSPNYFNDKVMEDLSKDYRNSKIRENSGERGNFGGFTTTIQIYRYNEEYSTSSKYTYREQNITCTSYSQITPFGSYECEHYGSWRWGTIAYSFSSDRSEMFTWSINNTGLRHYYKRIYESDLETNLDFLN